MYGVTEKGMQVVVRDYNYKDFFFPTLMPLKETEMLTYKALEMTAGLRVAADVVARGTSIDAKTREAIQRIQGDIPKIAIKRTMEEDELNAYEILKATAKGDAGLMRLIEEWAEDTKFVWNGVAARMEFLALRGMSTAKVSLTSTNNHGVVTTNDFDYGVDASHKSAVSATTKAWSKPAAAKPFTDLQAIVKSARANGIFLKYAFMNATTFANMVMTEEVIKACASFANNALNISQVPSLAEVNAAMLRIPMLYGLQIIVLDQSITYEDAAGTRTSSNPFVDGVVTLTEDKVVGNTFWKRPADMNLNGSAAVKVMQGPVCIKKYSLEEPIMEVTMGLANAMPVFSNARRSYFFETEAASWQY